MSRFLLIFATLRQEYVPINAFQVKLMLYGRLSAQKGERDMKFDKLIKNHLASYKLNTLKIIPDGVWWKNKKTYTHILPKGKYIENIINKGFQADLIKLINTKDFHLGFHHLNSSQALALNLFGPLVCTKKLSILGELLEIQISDTFISEFEYIENPNENTNFDFFIKGNNFNIYFEVKYTETEFGKAKDDEDHREKYNNIYKDNLEQIVNISQKQFFNEYQLWRNILYSEKGYIVFVVPKFRTDLVNIVEIAKKQVKNNNNVKILTIDDVVNKCKEYDVYKDHYIEFENKYLRFV